MKKTIRLAAIAAVASLTIVACNNNKTAEEAVDSTAIEQVAEEVATESEAVADTVAAVVEEQVAAPAKKAATTAKKAATKKAESTTPTAKVEETKAVTVENAQNAQVVTKKKR